MLPCGSETACPASNRFSPAAQQLAETPEMMDIAAEKCKMNLTEL